MSASGEVTAASCRPNASKTRQLSNDELAQLRAWRESYSTLVIVSTETGTADAMSQKLTLSGTGRTQPTAAQQKELLDWAQRVYTATK